MDELRSLLYGEPSHAMFLEVLDQVERSGSPEVLDSAHLHGLGEAERTILLNSVNFKGVQILGQR